MASGYADITKESNQFVVVCEHCGNHDNKNIVMEINFKDKIMYYRCSECKRTNKLDFSLLRPAPYPKPVVSRL